MKTLYLIRHAKSSWNEPHLSDFERPLNQRGIESIILMGDFMASRKEKISHFFVSSAARTTATARGIVGKMAHNEKKISHHKELYLASARELLRFTCAISNDLESAALVGHNPGITDFCEYLTSKDIYNMPTCSIAKIEFNIDSWEEVSQGNGDLVFFQIPKEL